MSTKKSQKSRPLKKFFIALAILVLITVVLIGLDFYQNAFTAYAGYSNPVTIQIKKGSSVSVIARTLHNSRVISSYSYFRIYYRLFFNDTHFKTGEYRFDRPMTMKEVIEKLYQGKVVLHKITVREGLIIKEVAQLLSKYHGMDAEDFINHAGSSHSIQSIDPKAPDLEGYLYPDTYMVHKGITAEEMVDLMVEKFKENFTHSMKWRAQELNLSIREILTLASLIEKETSAREERFLISSVFHNRLRIGMAMGCDPTIIYALKRDNVYRGKLGWAELKYDSPYNTRLYRGLPPGPICNPGYASIEAALYPENTKYLYFVAKNSKSHYFSESLNEHNRAVRKYIINRKRN
ncbi:MAG: endolytic transglycosylase MltG [bacterium]|nr:endolytic transglycosylase MltG [bacterium]